MVAERWLNYLLYFRFEIYKEYAMRLNLFLAHKVHLTLV
jgi:hypothetical protein